MKKTLKIYTAVLLGVLIHVAVYLLFNVGMATYCCGFNLWYLTVSETWGRVLMIAAYPLWGVAVLLGISGFCFPKLRKPYLIYMIVCYGIELVCYIGMFFIPSYWAIPLGWLDPPALPTGHRRVCRGVMAEIKACGEESQGKAHTVKKHIPQIVLYPAPLRPRLQYAGLPGRLRGRVRRLPH